jgi:hypothetical protein
MRAERRTRSAAASAARAAGSSASPVAVGRVPRASRSTSGPPISARICCESVLFVVALGTDYNILMTVRLREEMLAGRPVREAVAEAVRHVARPSAPPGSYSRARSGR